MADDPFAAARAVADAVLFEGYVLYPYRASAAKNQLRWQFGVVVPPSVARRDTSERALVRTECIVDPGATPRLRVRVRCLQLQRRTIEARQADGSFVPVEALDVDGVRWVAWDEAVEHEHDTEVMSLLPLPDGASEETFCLHGGVDCEELVDSAGRVAGRAVRTRAPLDARLCIQATWAPFSATLLRVAVTTENISDWDHDSTDRDDFVRRSLLALHTMLALEEGHFISSIDPPDEAAAAVAACSNEGSFPVLATDDDTVVLSSPIILYDHPEVAPESPGDLFDATEIDEILALRVLTLTEEEKAEARGTDARAAAVVDRVDDLPPEVRARLHGAVRSIEPVPPPAAEPLPWWEPAVDASFDPWSDSLTVDGVTVAKGSKVRLRPSRRADAHDMFLADQRATVAGVFSDVDGEQHVAVSLDDDPANDALRWQGRYLFFHPDEIRPLEETT